MAFRMGELSDSTLIAKKLNLFQIAVLCQSPIPGRASTVHRNRFPALDDFDIIGVCPGREHHSR